MKIKENGGRRKKIGAKAPPPFHVPVNAKGRKGKIQDLNCKRNIHVFFFNIFFVCALIQCKFLMGKPLETKLIAFL